MKRLQNYLAPCTFQTSDDSGLDTEPLVIQLSGSSCFFLIFYFLIKCICLYVTSKYLRFLHTNIIKMLHKTLDSSIKCDAPYPLKYDVMSVRYKETQTKEGHEVYRMTKQSDYLLFFFFFKYTMNKICQFLLEL